MLVHWPLFFLAHVKDFLQGVLFMPTVYLYKFCEFYIELLWIKLNIALAHCIIPYLGLSPCKRSK